MMKANNELFKAAAAGLLVLGGCNKYCYQNTSMYSVIYLLKG